MRRLSKRARGTTYACSAAALFACQPELGGWGVAGLETGAATLVLTGAWLVLTARPALEKRSLLGMLLGILPWLRPELLAVCCDGRRTGVDAGLELGELARLLLSFGARDAINLDGGGSATLVHRGHLLNRPYSDHDQPAPESRPVVTALLFDAV